MQWYLTLTERLRDVPGTLTGTLTTLTGRACFCTLYIFSKPEKDKWSKRL